MNRFHSIATDKYVPLSFDNAYLFDQYDRINNFLIFNIDKKFKNLLAKPVKSNFEIEWYSTFKNLQYIEESPYRDWALRQYWDLYEELQHLLQGFSRTEDENVKNWVSIIKTVFNPENNLIFTDGKDISIIWGWKFENNQNQKPSILTDVIRPQYADGQQDNVAEEDFLPPIIEEPSYESDLIEDENLIVDSYLPHINEDDNDQPIQIVENKRFLSFLKYFAAKYVWILISLLILICLVFFLKSLMYN